MKNMDSSGRHRPRGRRRDRHAVSGLGLACHRAARSAGLDERPGADAVVSTLAATGLWLVAIWLGLGLLAVLAASLPGTAGAIARGRRRRSHAGHPASRCCRRARLGILAAPAAALASPVPSPSGARSTVPSHIDEHGGAVRPGPPGRRRERAADHCDTRLAHQRRAVPRPPSGTGPPCRTATVGSHPPRTNPSSSARETASGLITAARIGRPASNDQVAVAWPRWYAANRVEIGSDPNLIQPGQILHSSPSG